jgi:hypothetical protein
MFASQIIIYTSIMTVILIVIYTMLTRTDHYKCTEWAGALYPVNDKTIESCKTELKKYNSLDNKGAAYLDPGEWGLCKGTSCNNSGYQSRIQKCAHGDTKKCSGDLIKIEHRPCKTPVFAADNILSILPFNNANIKSCNPKAGWSDWSEWSDTCHPINSTDECGKAGEKIRTRLCNNPYPSIDKSGKHTAVCKVDKGAALKISLNNIKDDISIKKNISKADIAKEKDYGHQQTNMQMSLALPHPYAASLGASALSRWPPKITKDRINPLYKNTLIERESKSCPRTCIPVNGGVSQWTDWTQCNATNCNSIGSKARSRTCTNPSPLNGGSNCTEPLTESKECTIPCQVHGGWSNFGAGGGCTAEQCGTSGERTHTRTCDNPSPVHGGKTCTGSATKTIPCNARPCPIEGGWGSFGQWGVCSATTCGSKGKKTRTRTCDNPTPAHGGNTCIGSVTETVDCEAPPCLVNGGWGNYGEWSACSASECGTVGQHTRTRTCDNPSPAHRGKTCEGGKTETATCEAAPCLGDIPEPGQQQMIQQPQRPQPPSSPAMQQQQLITEPGLPR